MLLLDLRTFDWFNNSVVMVMVILELFIETPHSHVIYLEFLNTAYKSNNDNSAYRRSSAGVKRVIQKSPYS